jgi:hypothetical protein
MRIHIGFANLLTQYVDSRLASDLNYKARTKVMADFILENDYDVFGACECGAEQAILLEHYLAAKYTVYGWCSGAKEKKTHESLQRIKALIQEEKQNPFVGEFYLLIVRKTIPLMEAKYVEFPAGARHERGAVTGSLEVPVALDGSVQQLVFIVSHFDHLDAKSRKAAFVQLERMCSGILAKGAIPISMIDTNNFPDVSPQDEDVRTAKKDVDQKDTHHYYIPTSSFAGHQGAAGTYIGNESVDAKFLPTLGCKMLQGTTRYYYVNSNCLDIIYVPAATGKVEIRSSKHMTVVMQKQECTDPVYGDKDALAKRRLATDHYVVDAVLYIG